MIYEGNDRLTDRDATRTSPSAGMTSARTAATAAALTTLGLAAASWVVALRQMNGMDMGVVTELGSFAFFVALWVSMMAAMMLPGAVPAVSRFVRVDGQTRLPAALSRERPLGIRVRDLLRRLEHRVDGDAAGARRHEHRLDGVVAAVVLVQKLLPPRAVIDVPLALTIIAIGILVVVAPSSIPGLTDTM
jgi:hypothetical protein